MCVVDIYATLSSIENTCKTSDIILMENIYVYCNVGVTHTNNIVELTGYSNHVWYNPKGAAKIISIVLLNKHHLVIYNSKYGNKFDVHIPQQPTFKMNKAGLFYHNMKHLLKIE